MEEHKADIAFKEEYWDDALAVLKREERKARRRRFAFFFPLLGLIGLAAGILISREDVKANALEMTERDPLLLSFERNASPMSQEEMLITAPSADTDITGQGFEATRTQVSKSDDRNADEDQVVDQSTATTSGDSRKAMVSSEYKGSYSPSESIILLNEPKANGATHLSPDLLSLSPKLGLLRNEYNRIEPSAVTFTFRKFYRIPSQPEQLMAYVGNAFTSDYGSVRGGTPLNPQAGIAFEKRLRNRLWMRLAGGVQQISAVNVSKEYRVESGGFGPQYASTVITTDRLILAEVPVSLIADLNMRHSLLFGAGMEFVLTTRNRLVESEVTAFSTSSRESEDNGYLTGFNRSMYNLHLGYRYRLTRRSSLDLMMFDGFTPVIEGRNDRNRRWVIRLNWNLL